MRVRRGPEPVGTALPAGTGAPVAAAVLFQAGGLPQQFRRPRRVRFQAKVHSVHADSMAGGRR